MASHVNTDTKLVTHFYAQEVTETQFNEIEKSALNAPEWGVEVSLFTCLDANIEIVYRI